MEERKSRLLVVASDAEGTEVVHELLESAAPEKYVLDKRKLEDLAMGDFGDSASYDKAVVYLSESIENPEHVIGEIRSRLQSLPAILIADRFDAAIDTAAFSAGFAGAFALNEIDNRFLERVIRYARYAAPVNSSDKSISTLVLELDDSGKVTQALSVGTGQAAGTFTSLEGNEVADILHPEDVDAFREMLNESRSDEGARVSVRMRSNGRRWTTFEGIALHRCGGEAHDGVTVVGRTVLQAGTADTVSEDSSRSLLDVLPDAIVRFARDGTYLEHSSLGYGSPFMSPRELAGKNVYRLFGSETAAKVRKAVDDALDCGEAQHFDFVVEDNGASRVREARIISCGGDEAVAVIRDVTESRRAEEELRKSEHHFRSLIENALDIIAVLDEQGRIRFISPSIERVLGYSEAELAGESISGFVHHEDRSQLLELFEAGVDIPGYVARFECRFRHKDGRWRTLEANARNLLLDDAARGIVVNSRDITQRIEAERALKRSERLLRSVVDSAPIILFATDRDGIFTLAQGKGLESLARPAGQMIDRSIYEVYADNTQIIAHVKQTLAGESFRSTVRIGRSTFDIWYAPLKNEDGDISGLIGVATDITELKKSEEEQRRSRTQLRNLARKLQSVREDERTRIAREIHDVLGQSLTVLKMDVTWLANRFGDQEPDLRTKTTSMVDVIVSTIQSVRKIATELRPGILDDLGLAAALEWQLQEFQARTGIACDFEQNAVEIEIDKGRSTSIFRIFQEVLTNIARHAEASHVTVNIEMRGSTFLMEVRDNGRGIRSEEIHSARSLGLLGMRERALAWGGSVHIQGDTVTGTTVLVIMPTTPTEEREAQP